jgi:hypothetical protein
MMTTTADKYARRTMVETIINLAANSMGNFTLVNVSEGQNDSRMEFELIHPFRGIESDSAKRILVTIKTEPE